MTGVQTCALPICYVLDKEVDLKALDDILDNDICGTEDTEVYYKIFRDGDEIIINFCFDLRDYNNIDELKNYFNKVLCGIEKHDVFSINGHSIKIKCNHPEVVINL